MRSTPSEPKPPKNLPRMSPSPLSSLRSSWPLADPVALVWCIMPGLTALEYAELMGISRKTYYRMISADRLSRREYVKLIALLDGIFSTENIKSGRWNTIYEIYREFKTKAWIKRYVSGINVD